MDLLTYDELRGFERAERESKSLIKLPPDFIERYLDYVSDKERVLGKDDDNLIAKKVKERAGKELINAKSSFKSLFESRAKKIIEQAFLDLKVDSESTDNFTHDESELYSSIKSILSSHEASLLIPKGNLKKPEVNPVIKDNPFVLVKFIRSIPLFAWNEGVMGPFLEKDVANIPKELAGVLLKQGSIEFMG